MKCLQLFFFLFGALVFSQNLDTDDPDGDGVINREEAADRDNRNTIDLDKDNDGIINSLENCNSDFLIEFDTNRRNQRITDVFILVNGIEIGVVTVEMVGSNNLALNNADILDSQDTRAYRAPAEDAVSMRWGNLSNGSHNGQTVQMDVTIYPDYNFFADDIRFRIFQGVESYAAAININRWNITSTEPYLFEVNATRIKYSPGNDNNFSNVPGAGANIAANLAQQFAETNAGSLNGAGAWWRATTESLGAANDGQTKTMRMSFNYTAGSDKAELLGFTIILDNSCTATSDADGDGIPNELDLDSDNDGCPDAYEFSNPNARVSFTNERLLGDNGTNGLNNALETNDTGDSTLGYTFNAADFDSNNNLVPDHLEASVQGPNCFKTTAGTALTGNATIGNMGISTVPNTANQNYFANGTTNALDVVSKTKGIGLPLVSNANLPLTVTAGTVLWNTDENCLMLWHADNGSGSAGWACVQRAGDGS